MKYPKTGCHTTIGKPTVHDQIDKFINTDFDVIKSVADNLETLKVVAEIVGTDITTLFSTIIKKLGHNIIGSFEEGCTITGPMQYVMDGNNIYHLTVDNYPYVVEPNSKPNSDFKVGYRGSVNDWNAFDAALLEYADIALTSKEDTAQESLRLEALRKLGLPTAWVEGKYITDPNQLVRFGKHNYEPATVPVKMGKTPVGDPKFRRVTVHASEISPNALETITRYLEEAKAAANAASINALATANATTQATKAKEEAIAAKESAKNSAEIAKEHEDVITVKAEEVANNTSKVEIIAKQVTKDRAVAEEAKESALHSVAVIEAMHTEAEQWHSEMLHNINVMSDQVAEANTAKIHAQQSAEEAKKAQQISEASAASAELNKASTDVAKVASEKSASIAQNAANAAQGSAQAANISAGNASTALDDVLKTAKEVKANADRTTESANNVAELLANTQEAAAKAVDAATKVAKDKLAVEQSAQEVEEARIEVATNASATKASEQLALAASESANTAKDTAIANATKAMEASKSASSANIAASNSASEAKQAATITSSLKEQVVVSESNAKNYADKSQKIYDAFSKGAVYRGVWNPMKTPSYPDAQGINSQWDVALNKGVIEHSWKDDKWYPGDRLIWSAATSEYFHVQRAQGVTTVNGRGGAVTITNEDVNTFTKQEIDAKDTATLVKAKEYINAQVAPKADKTVVDTKLNKAGDTMTGILKFGSNLSDVIQDAAGNRLLHNGGYVVLGNTTKTTAIDGGNTRLTIQNGSISVNNPILTTVSQSSAANSLTRRDYVDAQLNAKLNLAGGTMTGNLVLPSSQAFALSMGGHKLGSGHNSWAMSYAASDDSTTSNGWKWRSSKAGVGEEDKMWLQMNGTLNTKTQGVLYGDKRKPSANDVGALPIVGGSMTGGISFTNIPSATTYSSVRLSNYARGTKTYLRKFRGGASDTIWHETVQESTYRISTGDADTTEIFRLRSGDGAYVLGRKVYHEGYKPTLDVLSGIAAQAGNSNTVGGKTASQIISEARSGLQTADNVYTRDQADGRFLGINAKAADASKLNGRSDYYHPGNKPTASDVGALTQASADSRYLVKGLWTTNGGQDLLVHGKRALVGFSNGALHLSYGGDFNSVYVNNSKIYHEGNKPTPDAIGAIANAGEFRTAKVSHSNHYCQAVLILCPQSVATTGEGSGRYTVAGRLTALRGGSNAGLVSVDAEISVASAYNSIAASAMSYTNARGGYLCTLTYGGKKYIGWNIANSTNAQDDEITFIGRVENVDGNFFKVIRYKGDGNSSGASTVVNSEIANSLTRLSVGSIDTAGELNEKGVRVYSPNNKPSAAAIGALPASQVVIPIGWNNGVNGFGQNIRLTGGSTSVGGSKNSIGFHENGKMYFMVGGNNFDYGSGKYIAEGGPADFTFHVDLKERGQRVYSPNNKPNARDLSNTIAQRGTSTGQDFNTLDQPGYYKMQNGSMPAHGPSHYPYGMMEVIRNFEGDTENRCLQIYYPHADAQGFSFRMRNGSAWNSWAKVYTDRNKPTASEIGAAAVEANRIIIPNRAGSGTTGMVKVQTDSDSKTSQIAWLCNKPDTDPSHRGIGVGSGTAGAVYYDGTIKRIYHEGYKPTAADVGAAPKGLLYTSARRFTVGGDANTFYMVRFPVMSADGFQAKRIQIARPYNAAAPSSWNTSTHKGGLTLTVEWSGDSGWGGNSHDINVTHANQSYTTVCGGMRLTTGDLIIWLRGGGADYWVTGDAGVDIPYTVDMGTYTAPDKTQFTSRNRSQADSGWTGEITARLCNRNGAVYDNNQRVYSPNNKPSAADIGAVSKAGDAITGPLKIVNSYLLLEKGSKKLAFEFGSDNVPYISVDTRYRALEFTPDQMVNGTYGLKDKGQRVYSPNNKPTPTDIGAMPRGDAYTKAEINARASLTGVDNTIKYGVNALQYAQLHGNGGTGANGTQVKNPTNDWWHHIILNHANSAGYYTDIATCFHSDRIMFRRVEQGRQGDWKEIYHTGKKPTPAEIGALESNWFVADGAYPRFGKNNWLRANTNEGGFLPFANGESYLGTSGWRFKQAWVNDYRGGSMTLDGNITANGVGYANDFHTHKKTYASFVCNGNRGKRFLLEYDSGSGNMNFIHRTDSGSNIKVWTMKDNGDFVSPGNITAYSDIRIKDDIKVIENPIEKVKQLRGVTYNRIDLGDAPRQTGVIAQEVEKVLPEAVTTSVNGDIEDFKAVSYGNMVGLLIEAIKEQQKQIDELKEMVNALTK